MKVLGRPNNRFFSRAFEALPNSYSDFIGVSEREHNAEIEKSLRKWAEELAIASKSHHTVLVSSEQISWRFGANEIRRLALACQPHFDEVTIVAFIRDQLTAIPSRYWLDLRTTLLSKSFERWVLEDALARPSFDYERLATAWRENFPSAQFRLIAYRDEKGFDAVESFYKEVSTMPPFTESPENAQARRNTSGSGFDGTLLRVANRMLQIYYSFSGPPKRLRSKTKKILRNFLPRFSGGRSYKLSRELAQTVVNQYYSSNLIISQQFFEGAWPFPNQLEYVSLGKGVGTTY